MRCVVTASLAVLVPLGIADSSSAAEWWQDSFVSHQSVNRCDNNDSIATYSQKSVQYWEEYCSVDRVTRLRGLDGVIFDLDCGGEGEEHGKRRELLLKLDDDLVMSFPRTQTLKRCGAVDASLPEISAIGCPFNRRLCYARLPGGFEPTFYQHLRFPSGEADGTATLTEYHDRKPVWTASGMNGCMTEDRICRLTFPTSGGEPVTLAYETTGIDGSPDMIVIPGLRQSVSRAKPVGTTGDHGGLAVAAAPDFVPAQDQPYLPLNVYRYDGCAPEEATQPQP